MTPLITCEHVDFGYDNQDAVAVSYTHLEISVAKSQYSNGEQIGSEIQLADSGYGQGQVLVNPIHLAALYTGFLNGGDVIKPYLLYREDASPEVWLSGAYTPEAAQLVEEGLEEVVQMCIRDRFHSRPLQSGPPQGDGPRYRPGGTPPAPPGRESPR